MPVSVEKEAIDMNNVMGALMDIGSTILETDHPLDGIYVNSTFTEMINTFISQSTANNLKSFKKYIDDNAGGTDVYPGYGTEGREAGFISSTNTESSVAATFHTC
jgi:putative ABC transport system permease protein